MIPLAYTMNNPSPGKPRASGDDPNKAEGSYYFGL